METIDRLLGLESRMCSLRSLLGESMDYYEFKEKLDETMAEYLEVRRQYRLEVACDKDKEESDYCAFDSLRFDIEVEVPVVTEVREIRT